MKVIILGAGQVGYSLAHYLAQEDNHITVVDQSVELLEKVTEKLDVQPVLGFASHPEVLEHAGASDADLLIAVTASDEVNMVACEVANSLFQVKLKVARVRHQNYLKNLFHPKKLAIDVVISPELEVAKAIHRNNKIVGAFEVASFACDSIKVIGVRCRPQSILANSPIRLTQTILPQIDWSVLTIKRDSKVFFPDKHDLFLPNDEIHFLSLNEHITPIMEAFGYYQSQERQLIIVGGGNIGRNLALEIETTLPNVNLKLIEKSAAQCELAAQVLQHTTILEGDGLDFEILQEAGIESSEALIAVTNDEKINILASLVAKRHGVGRTVTLLNNMVYSSLITALGIDAVISPKALTISTILRHVRQNKVENIHTLEEDFAVLIEAVAEETSHIVGLNLEDITIARSIYVTALIREERVICNPTQMIIKSKDHLIIVCHKQALSKVEKLFSIRPTYL